MSWEDEVVYVAHSRSLVNVIHSFTKQIRVSQTGHPEPQWWAGLVSSREGVTPIGNRTQSRRLSFQAQPQAAQNGVPGE